MTTLLTQPPEVDNPNIDVRFAAQVHDSSRAIRTAGQGIGQVADLALESVDNKTLAGLQDDLLNIDHVNRTLQTEGLTATKSELAGMNSANKALRLVGTAERQRGNVGTGADKRIRILKEFAANNPRLRQEANELYGRLLGEAPGAEVRRLENDQHADKINSAFDAFNRETTGEDSPAAKLRTRAANYILDTTGEDSSEWGSERIFERAAQLKRVGFLADQASDTLALSKTTGESLSRVEMASVIRQQLPKQLEVFRAELGSFRDINFKDLTSDERTNMLVKGDQAMAGLTAAIRAQVGQDADETTLQGALEPVRQLHALRTRVISGELDSSTLDTMLDYTVGLATQDIYSVPGAVEMKVLAPMIEQLAGTDAFSGLKALEIKGVMKGLTSKIFKSMQTGASQLGMMTELAAGGGDPADVVEVYRIGAGILSNALANPDGAFSAESAAGLLDFMSKDSQGIPDKAWEQLLPILSTDKGRKLLSMHATKDFIDQSERYANKTSKAIQESIINATVDDVGFKYKSLPHAFGMPIGLGGKQDNTDEERAEAEINSRLNVDMNITPDGNVVFTSTDKDDERANAIASDLHKNHSERLRYLVRFRQGLKGETAEAALAALIETGRVN